MVRTQFFSKTPEQKVKKAICDWNYSNSWLPLGPKENVTPLSEAEIQELESKQDGKHGKFALKLTHDNVILCSNRHGGLVLFEKGYMPTFFL